jgi:hypothetical protein
VVAGRRFVEGIRRKPAHPDVREGSGLRDLDACVMETSFMPREVGDDIERNMDDLDYEFEDGATFDLEEFVAMGINPSSPTTARPGSEEKVLMLSARYAAGMPLWHEEDCYDHGPNELQLMGNHGLVIPSAPLIPLDESEEEDL